MLPTIVSRENLQVLEQLVRQAAQLPRGEFWECGVYQGGTASIIQQLVPTRTLRLFDSFEGLPRESEWDNQHKQGDFNDVDLTRLQQYFQDKPLVHIHRGWIPQTFQGLEQCEIAFCHVDTDLYEGYLQILNWVWPRMVPGGIVKFDDYHAPSCLGARRAVDEWCQQHSVELLHSLPHGAWIVKR